MSTEGLVRHRRSRGAAHARPDGSAHPSSRARSHAMGRQFFLDGRFKADGGIGFVHPSHASRAQPDSTEERLDALVVAGVWSLRDFAYVLQFVSEDFDELVVASFRADDNAEVPVLSAAGDVMEQISVELEPLRYDARFDVDDDVRVVEGLDEATKGRRARPDPRQSGPSLWVR